MRPLNKTAIIAIVLLFAGVHVMAMHSNATPSDTLDLAGAVDKESEEKEYQLVIFDSRFHHWFNRTSRPPELYSLSYLEDWNKRLVNQWNQLYHSGRRCRPEVYLKYDADIAYGKELNHQLFYYFRYMHERCRMFSVTPGKW